MKVFLSFLQGKPHHPVPAYNFWEYYIKNGIEEAGHSWVEVPDADWAYGLVPKAINAQNRWKDKIWSDTIEYVKKARPDLFLSYLYPTQIDKSALEMIKAMGVPTVNFFCDNVREFQRVPQEFQPFDLNWVPEYKALSLYRKQGYPFIHLPMPAWVEPKNRKITNVELPQVSFIGSKDIQRQLLFEEVIKKQFDFNLCIYGSGWNEPYNSNIHVQPVERSFTDKIHNQFEYIFNKGFKAYSRKIQQRKLSIPVTDELSFCLKDQPSFPEYIHLTKSSFVTLGVNRYPSFRYPLYKPNSYSRLRDIEAPMLGACYLTEWTEGIDCTYDLNKEIKTYASTEELIEKVKEIFKDKQLRTRMRELAQKRALSQLCIPATFMRIQKHFDLT